MSTAPGSAALQRELWRVAAQLEALPAAPGSGHRLDDLSICFSALREPDDAASVEIEERIWTIWCDHPQAQAKAEMVAGIRVLAAGALTTAEEVFDQLVERYPTWAETWNKRATVYFLQGRDSASISDIYRTLELEPRHFGALGGFAQICMRNGAADAARAALGRLLIINPRALGVAEAIAAIGKHAPTTMH